MINQPVINTTTLYTRRGVIIAPGTLGTVRGLLRGGQLLQVEFRGRGFVQTTPDRVLPVHLPDGDDLDALGDDLIALVEHLSAEVERLSADLDTERAKVTRLQKALDAAVKLAGRGHMAPPRLDFSWRKLPENDGDRSRFCGNGHHSA